jgi:membrane-associated phospholipid phosphatase
MTIRRKGRIFGAVLLINLCAARASSAQEAGTLPSPLEAAPTKHKSPSIADAAPAEYFVAKPSEGTQMGLVERFLDDQREIWRGPARLRFSDTAWVVPLGGVTAGLFVTDHDFSKHLSQSPSTISHYKTLSNGGVAALIGGAGGMWLLGHARHNEHWSETGFLAGEATLNSLVVAEGMKYSLRRERPFGAGSGSFFQNGGTSFPSEHAAAAWSVAGVVAHEYPGPLTKIMAYGLASLVSVSRVKAHQHFPSDVLVGSVIGNLVAQNIYSRHRDPDLGGGEWRSISQIFRGEGNYSAANQGSPYVPLDSWIYPAIDRLSAMGMIDSGFAGMRPWTRRECARLLNEAGENLDTRGSEDTEALRLHDSLAQEFSNELFLLGVGDNRNLQLESVYARVTEVSGQPLTDGNHFGRTIANNFGRPFARGFNAIDGFSGWASEGRFTAYIRGEYQQAPSSPALSEQARLFIAGFDRVPVPANTSTPAISHFQLLDAYIAMNIENWQLSFGKQSLWWGPGEGGPLMFSDNAEPVNMLRVSRVSPFKLPRILSWLGQTRVEFFMGQLGGHEFIFDEKAGFVGQSGRPLDRQPLLHGEKISFKPTPNFEFSVSETTVFAGGPTPLNWHNLIRSYTGFTVTNADITDPRSGVDFTYRVPWVRKWLTFYGDAFTEDEYSPLSFPRKSAFQAGIYMPRLPGFPKLDLRFEGGSTVPPDFPECQGCFYANNRFPDGSYMNRGNLMGSWLGRAGQGEQAWSTYWLSSRNTIQFHYRHQKMSGDYLPQGGTVNDGGVKADIWLSNTTKLSGSMQYEEWNIPVLDPLVRSNVTTSIELSFWPRHWGLHAKWK